MGSQGPPDCKVLLESRDTPDRRDLKDTEVSSASRAFRVLSDLQEREELRARMVRTESRELLDLEVRQGWMELWVRWVTRALLDPGECRARRGREEQQESWDIPALQDLQENPLVLTWPLSLQ